jgi:BlaI family transcriptional regulator, penicillinase repressor
MRDRTKTGFSRRERQIMDIAYRLGSATAAEIHARMPDAPTYTTARGLLRILVKKGHLLVRDDGVRFVYRPRTPRNEAGASTLAHVIRTFFDGSPANAMAAMLGSADLKLSPSELKQLSDMVTRARAKDRKP